MYYYQVNELETLKKGGKKRRRQRMITTTTKKKKPVLYHVVLMRQIGMETYVLHLKIFVMESEIKDPDEATYIVSLQYSTNKLLDVDGLGKKH